MNLTDFVQRTSVITHNNEVLFPNPEPLPMLVQKSKKTEHKKEEEGPKDLKAETIRKSLGLSAGFASLVGLGCLCPDPAFLTMSSIFALAVVAGYQSVWGVKPALHTPLMSITNAISGITAAGGMVLLGGGFLPSSVAQF